MGVAEAHKRKSEIEAAVLRVFGTRYSTTNYWLLSSLQDKALQLKNEINNPNAVKVTDDNKYIDEGDDLPFTT